MTTLNDAIARDDLEAAQRLLEEGTQGINEQRDGYAPIHVAVAGDWLRDAPPDPKTLAWLIERGADVNLRSERDGRTPLQILLEEPEYDDELVECVRILLEAGADPTLEDEDGMTLGEIMAEGYYEAVDWGMEEQAAAAERVREMLVKRGMDPSPLDEEEELDEETLRELLYEGTYRFLVAMHEKEYDSALEILETERVDPNLRFDLVEGDIVTFDGDPQERLFSPLVFALEHKRRDIAIKLLELGADPNSYELQFSGKRALHYAIDAHDLELVKILLEHGADPEATDPAPENEDKFPYDDILSYARARDEEIYEYLNGVVTEKNQKKISRDDRATYDMLVALHEMDEEGVREALARGADPNAAFPFGWEPSAGYDPSTMDQYIMTPLIVAMQFKLLEAASLLLEAGANPNVSHPFSGSTPLHMAVVTGKFDIVKKLVEAGADPLAENGYGQTALELAKDRNAQIYHYLREIASREE